MTDDGGEHAEPNLDELGTGPANPRATFVEMAVSAAGVGTFDWDLLTGTLVWDERLIDLFGYEPSAFDGTVEAFRSRVHPDDVPRVSAGLQQAILRQPGVGRLERRPRRTRRGRHSHPRIASRHRRGAYRHHDARNGWLRNHAGYAANSSI